MASRRRGIGSESYLDLADTAGIAGLAQSGFGVHGDDDAMRLFHASRHDQDDILRTDNAEERNSMIRKIEYLDKDRSGETGVRLKDQGFPQRFLGPPAGETRKRG